MSHHHDDVPLRILAWCAALQVLGTAVGFAGSNWTHSYAVFSDALHWLADVVPAIVTLMVRAIIQRRRRRGLTDGFSSSVFWGGMFNAACVLLSGVLAVREASHGIGNYHRMVHFWPAVLVAAFGGFANLIGHQLTHGVAHNGCQQDTRADIFALDQHLKVDTIVSAVIVFFLVINAFYRLPGWDTAIGITLGWGLIVYGVWLTCVSGPFARSSP